VTPLQKIAMGLVIVVVQARFGGWDALADPLGWLLVIAGVRATRGHLRHQGTAFMLALLALLVAVVTYPPSVTDGMDPAEVWLLNLPQVAFESVLAFDIAEVLPADRWFRPLGWVLVVLGIAPAIVVGSDSDVLAGLTLLAWYVGQLVLLWRLFEVGRRPETGANPPVTPTA
jgi:hypothetical protein